MLFQVFTTRPSGRTIKTHGLIRIRGEQAAPASHTGLLNVSLQRLLVLLPLLPLRVLFINSCRHSRFWALALWWQGAHLIVSMSLGRHRLLKLVTCALGELFVFCTPRVPGRMRRQTYSKGLGITRHGLPRMNAKVRKPMSIKYNRRG